MVEPKRLHEGILVQVETERMSLMAINREVLHMCLSDPDQAAKILGVQIANDVFSEESRQAMSIKSMRMLMVDERLHPWFTYFFLTRRSDQQVMGVSGFKGAPTPLGSVELGYAIHENFRNQGYMTEAVRALVQWAFQHDTCQRVIAETLRENLASQHVLQKAGLIFDRGIENMLYWTLEKELPKETF